MTSVRQRRKTDDKCEQIDTGFFEEREIVRRREMRIASAIYAINPARDARGVTNFRRCDSWRAQPADVPVGPGDVFFS